MTLADTEVGQWYAVWGNIELGPDRLHGGIEAWLGLCDIQQTQRSWGDRPGPKVQVQSVTAWAQGDFLLCLLL